MKQLWILIACALCIASCGKEEYDSGVGYEQAIKNYMANNNWQGYKTQEGVWVVVEKAGSAEKPAINSTVRVAYKGYYTDDTRFDGSDNAQFNLQQVIAGWRIGIPEFGKGGKGHLLIPPNLAYGEVPSNSIRPRSVLIFDVELLDF